ncbi:hypothetical protein SAMN06295998_1066 [Primorskyibacter flagellatus]|uniref:Uncharacterized protein n=1 Tax=Primorskyibacter flagellatus TaxID=1387277 RepID=A0A1W2C3S2_9RHOB|nr:hypothetical protein SAMN06295998_1066 [Primorskyibacter flagellatus]
MSFPKKGKFFLKEIGYHGKGDHQTKGSLVEEIASALKR